MTREATLTFHKYPLTKPTKEEGYRHYVVKYENSTFGSLDCLEYNSRHDWWVGAQGKVVEFAHLMEKLETSKKH